MAGEAFAERSSWQSCRTFIQPLQRRPPVPPPPVPVHLFTAASSSTSAGGSCRTGFNTAALTSFAIALVALRRNHRRIHVRHARVLEVETQLSVAKVEESWAQAESLGKAPQEIAQTCALLCCVQRQLGYWAALHEGAVGAGSVVSRAPPLPLVLSWEGSDEVYGMSLASTSGSTLLQQLLSCVRRAQGDKRCSLPEESEAVKDLKAKVSLLRCFEDISDTPSEWTPGTHGLWYSDGSEAQLVYLPKVAEEALVSTSNDAVETLLRILRDRADREKSEQEDEDDDEDEEEEEEGDLETLILPEGHRLFRFEALQGECALSALPTLRTRNVTDEHVKELLSVQARIQAEDQGSRTEGALPRFAVLSASESQARAIIVPSTGVYGGLQSAFSDTLRAQPLEGLEEVRRVFVLAPVWDCYIDGCGIPEQRCAWYGKVPLDIPELQQLRSSKAFQELTVEQDERERAIEALLPLASSCLAEDQEFTLVPVMVGGLMSEKAELYTKLLAPYVADPANLFVIGGDAESLSDGFDLERSADLSGGPKRFMMEASQLVNKKDQVVPVFSALELFLCVLSKASVRDQLVLSRYW
eukprot:TRINITY_DN81456_c0_g1_i1.p1 TRINITY_DN81456_c0_g1~~TRINITY_DN81456_c0_g1_i1.p1  ORF type:complete len:585 (-),score=146.75 TRINITY_DN81456_c0_g1_i1:115-1869(-)